METKINDIPNNYSWEIIRREDSAYVIGYSWSELNLGHLVTINDDNEWKWFKNQFIPEKYAYPDSFNNYPNGEVQLWVGLNDSENENNHKWI